VTKNIKNSQSKKVHQKGSKSKKKKKDAFKAGIEPRMGHSLQLKELGVQNTTAVYPWLASMQFNFSLSLQILTCGNKNNRNHIA